MHDLDAREKTRQRPASARAARVGRDLDAAVRVFLLRGVGRDLGLVEEPELLAARLLARAPEALVAEQPHVLFELADLRGLRVDLRASLAQRQHTQRVEVGGQLARGVRHATQPTRIERRSTRPIRSEASRAAASETRRFHRAAS